MITELLQATDDLGELARQACGCGHLPDVHDDAGCWNCDCKGGAATWVEVRRGFGELELKHTGAGRVCHCPW
jgi:hypothetical protein